MNFDEFKKNKVPLTAHKLDSIEDFNFSKFKGSNHM